VIKVVRRLTMTAWLALEGGLPIRGQVRGKGGTAQDQGTLWLNFVIITAAVVAAGMLTGVVNNAAAWPSRLSAAGFR
jgi:hypothetical protein